MRMRVHLARLPADKEFRMAVRISPPLALVLAALLSAPATAQVTTVKRLPAKAPASQSGIVVQGGREAIGPKQDDPRAAGIVVQGGREAIGPKQDDPRAAGCTPGTLAIGPKQDDPATGALARPGDDEDPQARGGSESIGPKQDDPRVAGIIVQGGREAIGPKQDDPRSGVAIAARPGDDEDPQARCIPQGR
jgi:hypothetical protein